MYLFGNRNRKRKTCNQKIHKEDVKDPQAPQAIIAIYIEKKRKYILTKQNKKKDENRNSKQEHIKLDKA